MKIFFIAGARPNFMKIAPIAKAFDKQKQIQYKIVHTASTMTPTMTILFEKSTVNLNHSIV